VSGYYVNKVPKYSDSKYDIPLLEELGIDAFTFIKSSCYLIIATADMLGSLLGRLFTSLKVYKCI
jgi:hypothetical protein